MGRVTRAVIDQPGLRVLLLGLIIAGVLGFALRSQLSSSQVQKALNKSIQILNKDFSIDFVEAEVRLSKWGLPLPHLIISKLRISPRINHCQSSQIFIDELEVPLSFSELFAKNRSIELIRARNVEVRLGDLNACFASKNAKPRQNQQVQNQQGQGHVGFTEPEKKVNDLFSKQTRTLLKEVAIDQLKIVTLKSYDQPLIFRQIKFEFSYADSRLSQVDVKSRLYSLKDNRTDVYFLIADFAVQVKPDEKREIEMTAQLKGRLLDGFIQVLMSGSTRNQKVSFEVSTQNVSVKAYSPLLARQKKNVPLDRWPLSISFYLSGESQRQGQDWKTILRFKDFEAQSETMSLESSDVTVEMMNQQVFLRPLQVNLNQFQLSPFKYLLADQFDFQSIENLGIITGKIKYENQHKWNFDGVIKKVELIFSNRGSREIESIDSADMKLNYQDRKLGFSLENLIMQQQEVLGGLEGSYQESPRNLQMKLDLVGLSLNEKIWKQLTLVTQNPMVNLNWIYKKSNEERHQIKLTTSQLEIQGLSLRDVQIDFMQLAEEETRSIALNVRSSQAAVTPGQLKGNFLKNFFNEKTELNSDLKYLSLKNQLSLQGVDWRNMNFDLDMSLYDESGLKFIDRFSAKGDWRADRSLSGVAILSNLRRQLKFDILKNSKSEIDVMPTSLQE